MFDFRRGVAILQITQSVFEPILKFCIKGSRWGINGFNSGVLFLERAELIKLLERRKSIDLTASQILTTVNDDYHMRKIAITSYSMGVFKLLWKTMIQKQLKSDFTKRLNAVEDFRKSIKTYVHTGTYLWTPL